MAKVSTYLNFSRNTEEAFTFYKSVFGSEFIGEISRFSSVPPQPNKPLAESDKNLIMHISLPILGGHVLHGTDAPESMGFKLIVGNNAYINLEPDNRTEAKRLYDALSAGGKIELALQEMFWGDYFASFTDTFGTNWMINCTSKT